MQSTRRDELRNEMRQQPPSYRRVIEVNVKPPSTLRRSFRCAGSIFLTFGLTVVIVAVMLMVTR